jgi:hypothetical protein
MQVSAASGLSAMLSIAHIPVRPTFAYSVVDPICQNNIYCTHLHLVPRSKIPCPLYILMLWCLGTGATSPYLLHNTVVTILHLPNIHYVYVMITSHMLQQMTLLLHSMKLDNVNMPLSLQEIMLNLLPHMYIDTKS